MWKIGVLALLLMYLIAPARGQPEYRLTDPDAGAYLRTLLDLPVPDDLEHEIIMAELRRKALNDGVGQQEIALIDAVVSHLYGERGAPFSSVQFWQHQRIVSWLNAEQTDLSDGRTLTYDGLPVPVTALDLDSDGRDEWLLDLRQQRFMGYLIVQRRLDGLYWRVDHPIPFRDTRPIPLRPEGEAYWDIQPNGEQAALIVHYRFDNDYYENASNEGRYYILAWHDGALVDVGAEELSYREQSPTLQWQWVGDELHQTRKFTDNWDCEWLEKTLYSWDGSQFVVSSIEAEFPDTFACTLRHAENAMFAGDYTSAASRYERVLNDFEPPNCCWSASTEFVSLRWAMALLLSGHEQRGIDLLRELSTSQEPFPRYTELLDALRHGYDPAHPTLSVCVAAYRFFSARAYYFYEETSIDAGRTEDNILYGRGMYQPPRPYAGSLGCPAREMVESLIRQHRFTIDRTPLDHLVALGMPPSLIYSVYREDHDRDGLDEWFVWVDWPTLRSLYFVPNGETYHVSFGGFYPSAESFYNPTRYPELMHIRLPDGSSGILGVRYSPDGMPSREPGDCPAWGEAQIWRLSSDGIESIYAAQVCERLSASALVDDPANVTRVTGWIFPQSDYIRVESVWDETTGRYIFPAEVEALFHREVMPDYYYVWIGRLLSARDDSAILDYYQQALDTITDPADPVLLRWRYAAALTFEATGQPDRALAEYVTLKETAPDSLWGRLAALRLTQGG